MSHQDINYWWVITSTHNIAENHLNSALLTWVIVMSHCYGAYKTGIWNNVFPYFCVGEALKLQKINVIQIQILFALKWYA